MSDDIFGCIGIPQQLEHKIDGDPHASNRRLSVANGRVNLDSF
jgi:hypothetical protein